MSRLPLAALALILLGCAETSSVVEAPADPARKPAATAVRTAPLESCVVDDAIFVRRTMTALWGRHPTSQAEVKVLVETLQETGRDEFLRQMMKSPEYISYWTETLHDFLSYNRFGERVNDECAVASLENLGPGLAQHVRDNNPRGMPYDQAWTTPDLFASALMLDDLSPVYRVTLFATLGSRVIDADDDNDERAFRRLYSGLFEQNYLGRRMDCLRCHNSEYSVTPSHTFPLRGYVERAVYGDSGGRASLDVQGAFRVHGVLSLDFVPDNPGLDKWAYGDGRSPWGMSAGCGQFLEPEQIETDPLGYAPYLVRDLGPTASIWDVESMLAFGFAILRENGLVVGADGTVPGEMALAWMSSATLANKVWQHVAGHPLTAPHNLPRNAEQRTVLDTLTRAFTDNSFSLKSMLIAALTRPEWLAAAPGQCDSEAPYTLPPVFDPWVTESEVEAERLNSVGDALVRHPPAFLLRAAAHALDWAPPNLVQLYLDLEAQGVTDESGDEPPVIAELAQLQTDLGLFVSDAEIGFRGSNFRENLAWEYALGNCRAPWQVRTDGSHPADMIDDIIEATSGESMEWMARELKNRILGTPHMEDEERTLLEALAGVSFGSVPAEQQAESGLRRLCAAWLASPDFQLGGFALETEGAVAFDSRLPSGSNTTVCESLGAFWETPLAGCP